MKPHEIPGQHRCFPQWSRLVILSQVDLLGRPKGGLVFLVELPDGWELEGEHHLQLVDGLDFQIRQNISALRCFNVEARVLMGT